MLANNDLNSIIANREFRTSYALNSSDDRIGRFIRFLPPTYPVESALSECIISARLIQRTFGDNLVLAMSGGIDSEAMARAFLLAQVSFKVAILRFKSGWNDYDISEAIRFCEHNQIDHTIFELDLADLYGTELYLNYALKYGFELPGLAAHIWLINQIQGVPIFAGNPPYYQLVDGVGTIGFPEYDFYCYDRYAIVENRPVIGQFFISTSELTTAFTQLPIFKNLASQIGTYNRMPSDYLVKVKTYNEAGISVLPRVDKFTGFEKLQANHLREFNCSWYSTYRQRIIAAKTARTL